MSKILIAITVLVLVLIGYRWWTASSAQTTLHSNVVTDSLGEDIKAKIQAKLSILIPALDNQMKQMMALGNPDPSAAKDVLNNVAQLHADVDSCTRQLSQLGDSQASITAWLAREQWAQFQQTEALFRKSLQN